MTLDSDIKQQLAKQAAELDKLMREEQGLDKVLASGFKGGLGAIMGIAYLLAVLLSIAIFYNGYQFFTAEPEQQVFWGVLLLLSFQAQVGTKLWIWLETHRSSTLRELKRLELTIAQLIETAK
ncbi:hypothetical protein SAMN05660691_03892 [Rheinheimera pacifica]|uniref:Uncharacterized protein n=1 Tax=Rheinheimera pacifica TaxID=173990 RepID=A0A1H6NIY6_9GAMM|nr:DUF6768 family protein [Rheinheimera pacifica]SEI12071.1 hypothetical protein SAMN05660691_03892 [Rheinheimera pacifica]